MDVSVDLPASVNLPERVTSISDAVLVGDPALIGSPRTSVRNSDPTCPEEGRRSSTSRPGDGQGVSLARRGCASATVIRGHV